MPGFILHSDATMQCSHQGKAATPPSQTRVLVGGLAVATTGNQINVSGCPFTVPGPKPQPCVSVRWQLAAGRVKVSGLPVLLLPTPGSGPGVCLSAEQAPQGPPLVSSVQTRVIAQ